MKGSLPRLLFWLIAAPFWGTSGLFALFSLLSLLNAPRTASEKRNDRDALLRRAALVDVFLKTHGQLPSRDEFANASSNLNDGATYRYDLWTNRPGEREGFRFPQWSEGKRNFAVWYWAGEWSEFYDSNSKSTTLDETSKVSCWIKDALWPLGVSLVFGTPPFVILWIWRKYLRPKPPEAAAVLACLFFLAQLPVEQGVALGLRLLSAM
jgi:hypothetical protein